MPWYVWLISYLTCSFFVFRRVLYLFYKSNNTHMDNGDWGFASFIGFVVSLLGPLSLVVLVIHKYIVKIKKNPKLRLPLWVFVAVPFEKKVKEPEYTYDG